jgi:hypothetical protein
MESQLDTIPQNEVKPPVWTTPMLFYAMDWWQRNGNFNKDLYEKLVEIKYQIEIK